MKKMMVSPKESSWKKPPSSAYKLNQDILFPSSNKWGFPDTLLERNLHPYGLIRYNDIGDSRDNSYGDKYVHFYTDDYRFESIWSNPENFLKKMQKARGVVSPDFSVFSEQPFAMNVWNTYRNRWLTAFLQSNGVHVIPSPNWGDESSFEFCFEGIPETSPLFVSTVGTRDPINEGLFVAGFNEMIKRIKPSVLYIYGDNKPVRFEDFTEEVYYYPSRWREVFSKTSN